MNSEGSDQFVQLTAQVRSLTESSQCFVQSYDEPIKKAAPCRRLRSAGRAGKIGRLCRSGHVDFPTARMHRNTRRLIIVTSAEVRRLNQGPQVGREPSNEPITIPGNGRLGPSSRAGEERGCRGPRHVDVTSSRVYCQRSCGILPAEGGRAGEHPCPAQVSRTEQGGEVRIQPRNERHRVCKEGEGVLRAPAHAR